ncbi:hypothetical protein GGP56_002387, partial [Salinibacter ruber]|nr:hypothetical protein [Salinibacter ruber]
MVGRSLFRFVWYVTLSGDALVSAAPTSTAAPAAIVATTGIGTDVALSDDIA